MFVSKNEFVLRQLLKVYTEIKDYRRMCESVIAIDPTCKDEVIKVAEDRGLVYVEGFGFLESEEYADLIQSPSSMGN